jgi:hypothetical protein
MSNFKQYLREAIDEAMISPEDQKVISAFFSKTPDVVGKTIKTSADDVSDFTPEDVRIDLINGRAKYGLAQYDDGGIISLANLGKMIDKTPEAEAIQNAIRNKAKDKDLRVL